MHNSPSSIPQKLTIGFSPCPNDTFIFDALANRKIDLEGLDFEIFMEDIDTLNNWALRGKLDISKISFSTWFRLTEQYALLNAGSALGKGCGPLLISRIPVDPGIISSMSIAIPGISTTANMLLDFAYPLAKKRVPMVFSAIEDAVLKKETDLGVIIHENRFTYQSRGLVKITDLGEYWEERTGCPIPLSGIAINQSISSEIQSKVDRLIKKSLEFAFSHYPELPDFVKTNAREMDEAVMRQHIDLYVNHFSLDLGTEGIKAIRILADQAYSSGLLPRNSQITLSDLTGY